MSAWHTMGAWGWAMMAFGILFWIALIGVIAWAVSAWTGGRGGGVSPETPREILDRRVAADDLDIASYERAVDALGKRHGLEGS